MQILWLLCQTRLGFSQGGLNGANSACLSINIADGFVKMSFLCVTSFYKMLKKCIQNLLHGKVLKASLFQCCVHNKCKSALTLILRYSHYI